MRAVIAVLCFIVVAFINPIDSMFGLFGKRKQQYQQIPKTNTPITYPKLSAHIYFALSHNDEVFRYADRGPVRVGIMVEEGVTYVIGYVGQVGESDKRPLCPFVHNGIIRGGWGRIKIRVDGDYAYQYVVMPEKDTAMNSVFYKRYKKSLIRTFEIVLGSRAKPLVPFIKPAALGHASSSQTSTTRGQVGIHQRSPYRSESQYGSRGQH